MPSIGFNAHIDRLGYYATLPQTGSSWITVLLRSANIEADATLADYENLATLLQGTTDEALFQNYVRKPWTPVRTVRHDSNSVLISAPVIEYENAGSSTGGQNDTIVKALHCYRPASSSADTAILPLAAIQIQATTDGNTMRLKNPQGIAVVDWIQAT